MELRYRPHRTWGKPELCSGHSIPADVILRVVARRFVRPPRWRRTADEPVPEGVDVAADNQRRLVALGGLALGQPRGSWTDRLAGRRKAWR